jgi:hypothetical protein
MESVQTYDQQGWYYLAELHKFVNGGMTDIGFINSVSGIVNRGCHNPPCATGDVDGKIQRSESFESVLMAMGLPSAGSDNRPVSPVPQSSSGGLPANTQSVVSISHDVTSLMSELVHYQDFMEQHVLSYTDITGVKKQSAYTFDKLLQSLTYAVDVGYTEDKKFYTDSTSLKYGFVNLAAFLSQSMTESIQYDACEEFHLDSNDNKFAISNSCGQWGRNYQDYKCDGGDIVMECPVITFATIEAVGGGKYNEIRPNFYCRSTVQEPFTGVFDSMTSSVISDAPYANAANRTDVEGKIYFHCNQLLMVSLPSYIVLNTTIMRRLLLLGEVRSDSYHLISITLEYVSIRVNLAANTTCAPEVR